MSAIGDNMRALRELHNLTQQELADVVGVTRETVNKWESGAISNVRSGHIDVLCRNFSLSEDDLRSESCGLASRMRGLNGVAGRPQLTLPLLGAGDVRVEVPASVALGHPSAFAVVVPDDAMGRVLPAGAYAIVDPALQPFSGSVVLADVPGCDIPSPRRLQLGSSKALLCAEGFSRDWEDVVVDIDDLHVLGTVVWFQPVDELS